MSDILTVNWCVENDVKTGGNKFHWNVELKAGDGEKMPPRKKTSAFLESGSPLPIPKK